MKIENKVEISFTEELPKELYGLTFENFFKKVKEENHIIIEKLKSRFGNSIFTPEAEKYLTEDEKIYLRLAQGFKEGFKDLKINNK